VGKRGAIVVLARLRNRYGIEEGATVMAEAREDGILIRPAVIVPIERYTRSGRRSFS
jgi:bifunctional DNA-binding transcriptional regulator/antitoxin component of YhaV-PrlF toxin-antitoxin module